MHATPQAIALDLKRSESYHDLQREESTKGMLNHLKVEICLAASNLASAEVWHFAGKERPNTTRSEV
eukprot:3945245-Amphidinium_carterae.1